ncbi:MAG: ADP-ribosylglycohydrolase family protein [Nitrospinae bacterium]|nr:ADP-ribosylglycohydrolase family protein [Nitrospinota bacterium]
MIGAIAGDIIGSVYEYNNIKTTDFPLFQNESTFTDDTVLTVALADSILHGVDSAKKYQEYYNLYPHAGYGPGFSRWASSASTKPYNSWGNGSAMRVSPIGFAYESLEEVLDMAKKSAEVTHNHEEGIKGAQATACSVFLARTGKNKDFIRDTIRDSFSYSLDEPLASIREHYTFDPSCQGTVPQAITAFLESENYEDAIRKAISIGGDSDTIACITGGIAQAFYREIPDPILDKVYEILDSRLRQVVTLFCNRYACH